MQRLEVSGAVRTIYGSLGVKRLITIFVSEAVFFYVLLTAHLSIILVINQLDAQNLVL